jgi:hypothetical protein
VFGTRIVSYERPGLVLRSRRDQFTLTYGEILTAERLVSGRGLRLHRRTGDPVRIVCKRIELGGVERALRDRGVRVVDQYGAMVTPELEDFLAELAREPVRLRQSSDDA